MEKILSIENYDIKRIKSDYLNCLKLRTQVNFGFPLPELKRPEIDLTKFKGIYNTDNFCQNCKCNDCANTLKLREEKLSYQKAIENYNSEWHARNTLYWEYMDKLPFSTRHQMTAFLCFYALIRGKRHMKRHHNGYGNYECTIADERRFIYRHNPKLFTKYLIKK